MKFGREIFLQRKIFPHGSEQVQRGQSSKIEQKGKCAQTRRRKYTKRSFFLSRKVKQKTNSGTLSSKEDYETAAKNIFRYLAPNPKPSALVVLTSDPLQCSSPAFCVYGLLDMHAQNSTSAEQPPTKQPGHPSAGGGAAGHQSAPRPRPRGMVGKCGAEYQQKNGE